jgi:hypothetical protein
MADVTDDDLLANAVTYLVDGSDYEAAQLLLAWATVQYDDSLGSTPVTLLGPRAVHKAVMHWAAAQAAEEWMEGWDEAVIDVVDAIYHAIGACLPSPYRLRTLEARVVGHRAFPNWRRELSEAARQVVHNQATSETTRILHWRTLRFRSQSEIRIAQALERAGVMFLPNCKARLPVAADEMGNREPDFLVCADGHWGILEVDGDQYHPPEGAAKEHERDRLFRARGLKVERYSGGRCFESADAVVAEFLELLRQG